MLKSILVVKSSILFMTGNEKKYIFYPKNFIRKCKKHIVEITKYENNILAIYLLNPAVYYFYHFDKSSKYAIK